MTITQDAKDRLPTQFKESKNINNYIDSILSPLEELPKILIKMSEQVSINFAVGVQLDLIGEIVGLARTYIDASTVSYFGFADDNLAKGFNVGAFVSVGESIDGLRLMSDDQYRFFLRVKIIINKNLNTPEDLIRAYKYMFSCDQIILLEGDTSISLAFGKILTENEKWYLNNYQLPKPAGVRITYLVQYIPNETFAFQGTAGARGFGIGKWASLI